jgi:hypothetical protein
LSLVVTGHVLFVAIHWAAGVVGEGVGSGWGRVERDTLDELAARDAWRLPTGNPPANLELSASLEAVGMETAPTSMV